jgi:hypothetical protein
MTEMQSAMLQGMQEAPSGVENPFIARAFARYFKVGKRETGEYLAYVGIGIQDAAL